MTERTMSVNKEVYKRPLDSSGEAEKTKRMKIELYLPPSDIPQLIIPSYTSNEDILVIKFEYIGSEKGRELFKHENMY